MRTPHRGPLAREHGPRRVSRLLVYVETVGCLLVTVTGHDFSTVVHLTDVLQLWDLRQVKEHDV